MAKKRVTIYLEESLWVEMKECAFRLSSSVKRISVGEYLAALHEKYKPMPKENGFKVIQPEVQVSGKLPKPEIVDEINEKLREASEERDREVAEHVHSEYEKGKEVIDKARKKINDKLGKSPIDRSWESGEYSKKKQVGKK